MLGTVFNIQRFSLFDGPGVRTVVFLKGCPLRCRWCHNPEGLSRFVQIMFDAQKCIGCKDCVEVCPKGLHIVKDGIHGYVREGCIACQKCADVCASQALSTVGKTVSADDVMDIVMRDMPVYKESGGGITLSGGEPLSQAEFSVELLKKARSAGISTCVETSGFGETDSLLEMAEFTDVFYFDYKATGDAMHTELCGVAQKKILENLAALDAKGHKLVLRCPVIPGLNDTEKHIAAIGDIAAKYSCISEVQLEAYHKLGISKAKMLGKEILYDGEPPKRELLLEFCKVIGDRSQKKTTVS